jgi:NTE family protein
MHLLAAGYTPQEMGNALSETIDGEPVFKRFLETPPELSATEVQNSAFRKLLSEINLKFLPDFIEEAAEDKLVDALRKSPAFNHLLFFFDQGGLYAGEYFLGFLREKLNAGIYPLVRGNFGKGTPRRFGSMNLQEFFEATGMELSLVASDTSDAKMLVLNHRTAPDCPLVYAVRMSMSFPFIWSEVTWQAEWGLYRGKDLAGHTIVDGGMLSNFPIELFISNQPFITDVMGEKTVGVAQLLGFLIDETLEVPGAPAPKPGTGLLDKSLDGNVQLKTVERIGKLINTMTQAHDKLVIERYEQFVIHLPAKTYGTTEFDMEVPRREALVNAGCDAARKYFEALAPHQPLTLGPGLEALEEFPADFSENADRISKNLLDM